MNDLLRAQIDRILKSTPSLPNPNPEVDQQKSPSARAAFIPKLFRDQLTPPSPGKTNHLEAVKEHKKEPPTKARGKPLLKKRAAKVKHEEVASEGS